MTDITSYFRSLVRGRYKFTQVLASNTAGAIPTLDELKPGQLAMNFADQKLYSANDTAVYIIAESDFDPSLFVSNTYLQATFITNAAAQADFVANVAGNAAVIPVGNNGNRPMPAANGYLRYNTDSNTFEGYVNGGWVNIDYPGGPNTAIQFNDSEIFEGSAAFTFDKVTNTVFVANTINSAIFISGNSTVNLFANSSLLKLAINSTVIANLTAIQLSIGSSVVNALGVGVGANVLLDTTKISIGNSTANLFGNSILVSLANSSGIANLQSTALTIGNSIANTLGLSVGGSGGMVINTTSYAAGANVFLDTIKLLVGNTTANLLANSIILKLANSTAITNITPDGIKIGTSIVNTAGFFGNGFNQTTIPAADSNTTIQFNDSGVFGGNVAFVFNKTTNVVTLTGNMSAQYFLGDGSHLTGISTVTPGGANTQVQFNDSAALGGTAGFTFDKSTNIVFIANSLGIGGAPSDKLEIVGGHIMVGRTDPGRAIQFYSSLYKIQAATGLEFYTAGTDRFRFIDGSTEVLLIQNATIFMGNTIANLTANSILISLANATAILNLQPTQIVLGSATVNTTAYASGANVFLDTTKLSVGNSTANLLANSILLKLANSSAITNVSPDGLIIGISVVNTAGLFGNGAGVTSVNAVALEGHAAAYFQAALGYVPVNQAGDTMSGTLNVGANVNLSTTSLQIGNSTVNVFANSVLIKIANSTGIANLTPTTLIIGGSTVNATAYVAGANVFLDTTKLSVGNSIANLTANSILVSLANATATLNLQPTQVVLGSATLNTTAILLGANVFVDTTKVSVGNSIANLTANSILVSVANATATLNLQPTQIVLGSASVNTTSFISGANVFLDTTKLSVGNSTANLLANSILISVANATATLNLQPTQIVLGSATVNTTAYLAGANVFFDTVKMFWGNTTANAISNSVIHQVSNSTAVANLTPTQLQLAANVFLSTTTLSIGNSTANLLANSILVSLANSTATLNLQPTQIVLGSATINTTAYLSGANLFIDTVKLSIGNTTANLLANSILLKIANSTAITNVSPDGLIIGTSVVNTAGIFGNGAGLTSVTATATPGGANTNVQFNDSAAMGGSAGFTFTKTTNNVVVANTITIGTTIVNSTSFLLGNSTINVFSNSSTVQICSSNVGLPPGFVSVLLLNGASNAGIIFKAGRARDSTDAKDIVLTTTQLTKNVAAAWAVGNNAGGMDTGSVGASTTYYCWVILRSDTGVVDALFSLSATAPTMPTSYDFKQRVGWARTDSGSRFRSFTQGTADWSEFRYANTILDLNNVTINTTSQNFTLSLPASSTAMFRATYSFSVGLCAQTPTALIHPTTETNQAPSYTAAPLSDFTLYNASLAGAIGYQEIELNSSSQLNARTDVTNGAGSEKLYIATIGCKFQRGIIP